MSKTIFQLDEDGLLIGHLEADESPMEPGVFLIPAKCTTVQPFPHIEGKRQQLREGAFVYINIPVKEEDLVSPPETQANLETTI